MPIPRTAEEIPLTCSECQTLHYCAKSKPSLFKLQQAYNFIPARWHHDSNNFHRKAAINIHFHGGLFLKEQWLRKQNKKATINLPNKEAAPCVASPPPKLTISCIAHHHLSFRSYHPDGYFCLPALLSAHCALLPAPTSLFLGVDALPNTTHMPQTRHQTRLINISGNLVFKV